MATSKFTRAQLIPELGRFWPKVQIGGPDACWPWTRATDRDGYGRFSFCGTHVSAHRVAYTVSSTEDLKPGEVVMHSCDNPACCNPRHLRAGTQADNIADRESKGRGARGRHPNPIVAAGRIPRTPALQAPARKPRTARTASQVLADLLEQKRLKNQRLREKYAGGKGGSRTPDTV